MNAHRILQKVKGKHLNIELPETFRDADVEVIILKNEGSVEKDKLVSIQNFKGILKNSTYNLNEDEWYKQ